jgi:hypothetical protein
MLQGLKEILALVVVKRLDQEMGCLSIYKKLVIKKEKQKRHYLIDK